MCPRKWAFDVVWGYRGEEDYKAAWGVAGHAVAQAYLEGREPDVPPLEYLGVLPRVRLYFKEIMIPLLEAHGVALGDPALHVEHQVHGRFELVDGSTRWWWTFLDLAFKAEGVFEGQRYDGVVLDHKTMGSLRWAKSEFELRRSIQMNTCAFWAPFEAENYLVVHGQVQREGKLDHQKTCAVVSHEHVLDVWRSRVLPLVHEAEAVRRNCSYPGEVETAVGGPGSAAACRAFGGCAYLEACKLAGDGRADWEVPIASLRSAARDALAEEVMLLPPDSTRRPEGSPYLIEPNLEDTLRASLAGPLKGQDAVNALDELLSDASNAAPKTEKKESSPKTEPTPGASALDDILGGPVGKETQPEPPTDAKEAEAQARVDAESGEKPKRTRKKKGAANDAAIVEAVTEAAFEQGVQAANDVTTVYIDCVPLSGFVEEPVWLDQLLAPALAELRALKLDGEGRPSADGICWPDWRMIPYGKGAGFICAALRKIAAEHQLPHVIVVDTKSSLAGPALEVLRTCAQRIVGRI